MDNRIKKLKHDIRGEISAPLMLLQVREGKELSKQDIAVIKRSLLKVLGTIIKDGE